MIENRRKDDDRIENILTMLVNDIGPELKEVKTEIKDVKTKVEKTHTSIHGNGDLGLKTEVKLNKQSIKKHDKLLWLMTATVIIGVIKIVIF